MDSQQENVPPQCEESWFNGVIPYGKEFDLPDISSLISPLWTDISKNLPIPQDQLLDSPTAPDSAFVSDISNPLGAETQVALSPVIEMVPQTQFPRSAEIDGAFPVRNQLVQLPASESNLPMRKQQFDIVNSTNSSNFNSISSHLEDNPNLAFGSCDTSRCGSNICITINNQSSCISVPPNTPGFCSNDCNISNHGSFPSSGCTSALGSRVSVSIGNQKIISSGCPDLPSSGSNSSCARGNQLAYIPVMTNPPGFRSHTKNCPNHLQKSRHRTKIESNLSNPIRNQISESNRGPLSKCSGSVRNQQKFAPIPLQLGWAQINCDGNYTCTECNIVFPSYLTFGGHMSYHARERKLEASQLDASHVDSSRSNYGFGITKNRTEESSSARKDKEKSISPSIEAKAMERVVPSGDIRKKGRHKSSKRLSQEIFSPVNIVENRFSRKCKVPKIEPSSRGEIEESE